MTVLSGVNIDNIRANITDYLTSLVKFSRNSKLRLSAAKSSVSLFTTWTKVVRRILNAAVEGNIIPTVLNPKILGVTYDNLQTSPHMQPTSTPK